MKNVKQKTSKVNGQNSQRQKSPGKLDKEKIIPGKKDTHQCKYCKLNFFRDDILQKHCEAVHTKKDGIFQVHVLKLVSLNKL